MSDNIASAYLDEAQKIALLKIEALKGSLTEGEKALFSLAFWEGIKAGRKYTEILNKVFKQ